MTVRELLQQHRTLRGIAVGGCIETTKASLDVAHGHHRADSFYGWICIPDLRDLNPTNVIHELAHILRRNDRHDEAWKKTVRQLGGRVERRYLKNSAANGKST